jgi:nitrate reductase gamma subunit
MGLTFNMFDLALFAALPYVALIICFIGTIYRYLVRPFSVSSLSSQFLENKRHFWALVPFHYGILVVFSGHLIAFLIPRSILLWNSHPLRLFVLEISALAFALLTLVGLIGVVTRRITVSKVRKGVNYMDMAVYALLLLQITTGILVAVLHPWGSSWFASTLSPYLWSIFTLQPNLSYVSALPWLVKLHIAGAFVIIALVPFSRLMHVLVAPLPYLWRKPQVVRWYRPAPGAALAKSGSRN